MRNHGCTYHDRVGRDGDGATLARFYALGINLIKLESRPMPERSFEFMFYFDVDNSVYSPSFLQLMGELEDICEEYDYLGSYSEVV